VKLVWKIKGIAAELTQLRCSAYASCVAALYLAAREPGNVAGEAALPEAVRVRLIRQGMSLAVTVLGACVGFGSIAPYLLELLLHQCAWPRASGSKRPWHQVSPSSHPHLPHLPPLSSPPSLPPVKSV
jgi:hypothetical protein